MKKRFFIAALAAPVIMSSCLGDPADSTSKATLPIYNHVTRTGADGETKVEKGEYTFNQNITKATIDMTASLLRLGEQTGSFITPTQSYSAGKGYELIFKCQEAGNFNNDASMPVTGLDCAIYNLYNTVPETVSSTFPKDVAVPQQYMSLPIMRYSVGQDYKVRTFFQYPLYTGTTVTTDDVNVRYESKKMGYYISMDIPKRKATVVILNAKFSDKMGKELTALFLRNLDIKFTPSGYEVSGAGITPSIMMGTKETPVPTFEISSFQLTTVSEDMTTATAVYDVVNRMGETEKRYKGQFSGKYTYVAEYTGKPN